MSCYLLFNVANDSTFREFRERKNITHRELSFLSTINELTSVHSFCSEEQLVIDTILVWIPENNTSERCSASGIMNDFFDYPFNVTMTFSKVDRSMPGRSSSVFSVSLTQSIHPSIHPSIHQSINQKENQTINKMKQHIN
jgi:hypothetical protein